MRERQLIILSLARGYRNLRYWLHCSQSGAHLRQLYNKNWIGTKATVTREYL